MLTTVHAGALSVRGLSLGGIYTSLFVPEMKLALDAGIPARSFCGARHLLLTHGHADHAGALPAVLGMRALVGKRKPLTILMPAEIVDAVQSLIDSATALQRFDLGIDAVGLSDGDTYSLTGDLSVKAFRTYHPVPSLAYTVVRDVKKLRQEFQGLAGPEIAKRRRSGEDLFNTEERIELAYVTDTLVEVLDQNPTLLDARVLILECTFLDKKKSIKTARAGCHIHLDEILERQDMFNNEHIVLMHFSQLYPPPEVVSILDRRVPSDLRKRIIPLVPRGRHWPG